MRCSDCGNKIKPVVAIDIDGTLGDHHGHFQEFAETYVNRRLGPDANPPLGHLRRKPGLAMHGAKLYPYDEEFSEWLGLEKGIYREIKLAYRQGGMKRRMPVFEGADIFIHSLRQDGIEVWLCTTRPYLRLDNIDPDTREWLGRHKIEYDGLIYGEDKYHRLADIVGSNRVLGVIDDLPEMFDEAHRLGLSPIQKLNGHRGRGVRSPSVTTLIEAYAELSRRLKRWRERYGEH